MDKFKRLVRVSDSFTKVSDESDSISTAISALAEKLNEWNPSSAEEDIPDDYDVLVDNLTKAIAKQVGAKTDESDPGLFIGDFADQVKKLNIASKIEKAAPGCNVYFNPSFKKGYRNGKPVGEFTQVYFYIHKDPDADSNKPDGKVQDSSEPDFIAKVKAYCDENGFDYSVDYGYDENDNEVDWGVNGIGMSHSEYEEMVSTLGLPSNWDGDFDEGSWALWNMDIDSDSLN